MRITLICLIAMVVSFASQASDEPGFSIEKEFYSGGVEGGMRRETLFRALPPEYAKVVISEKVFRNVGNELREHWVLNANNKRVYLRPQDNTASIDGQEHAANSPVARSGRDLSAQLWESGSKVDRRMAAVNQAYFQSGETVLAAGGISCKLVGELNIIPDTRCPGARVCSASALCYFPERRAAGMSAVGCEAIPATDGSGQLVCPDFQTCAASPITPIARLNADGTPVPGLIPPAQPSRGRAVR